MGYKSIFKTFFNNDQTFIKNRKESIISEKFNSANIKKFQIHDKNKNIISCKLYSHKTPKRIIIALHDFKSSCEKDFAEIFSFLTDNMCSIFCFDMPSHGNSDGDFFTFGINERHTCMEIINYVCKNISESLPVYLYGMGAGGSIALMTTGMKLPVNIHGFIADSAYSHPYKYVSHNIKRCYGEKVGIDESEKLDKYLMKKYNLSLFDYTVSEAFKSNNRPILFFHGKKDKETPFSFAEENYANCKSQKELIAFENSEHLTALTDEHEKYCNHLSDFFKKHDNENFSEKISLHYPEKTMYQLVKEAAERLPNDNAYCFKGKNVTYHEMIDRIESAASAFFFHGITQGDIVTICMPNTPQAIDCLYGLNCIGATASLIHPLSAQDEIAYYIKLSKSKMILTLDLFYEKVVNAVKESGLEVKVLVARIQDELKPHLSVLYNIAKGKDYKQFPDERGGILWSDFIKTGNKSMLPKITFDKNRTAVVLYSGGTTGEPKGIKLSDLNFNALAMQARIAMECEFSRGLKNLSAMPIFHGFGLGIGIHTVLVNNACCVLMPQVSTKDYTQAMLKDKPNFIAGVPTIFKMLISSNAFQGKDLSFLKGMFVGGDSMPVELKKDVDKFLKQHGADIQVREGYGLTECVTASCLTPKDTHKEGSIGLPFPDTEYKIVIPDTDEELPVNTQGEIVISGATVMLGYLYNDEATNETLRVHKDGKTWLHTGDIGYIDSDGYIYYKQRIKRLIISSGYNVYPVQVEKAIELHPAVDYCCVIGVADEYKIERIKAYIVLKDKSSGSDELKKEIINHCKKYIASYELPKEIVFRNELPKTLVGKVAYRKLEEENKAV